MHESAGSMCVPPPMTQSEQKARRFCATTPGPVLLSSLRSPPKCSSTVRWIFANTNRLCIGNFGSIIAKIRPLDTAIWHEEPLPLRNSLVFSGRLHAEDHEFTA
jgi:hypothetical protein